MGYSSSAQSRHARRSSLPVPWAGDDRSNNGARDISCSQRMLGLEAHRTRCSSSRLVSAVAMFLASLGGRVTPAARGGRAAQRVPHKKRSGEEVANEDNSCPASSAICRLDDFQYLGAYDSRQTTRKRLRVRCRIISRSDKAQGAGEDVQTKPIAGAMVAARCHVRD
jgi:hypothetical protein